LAAPPKKSGSFTVILYLAFSFMLQVVHFCFGQFVFPRLLFVEVQLQRIVGDGVL
jgi:hypothetical protein